MKIYELKNVGKYYNKEVDVFASDNEDKVIIRIGTAYGNNMESSNLEVDISDAIELSSNISRAVSDAFRNKTNKA